MKQKLRKGLSFSSMKKDQLKRCCVCNKPFRTDESIVPLGSGLYRHRRCGPGSVAWLRKHPERELAKALYEARKQRGNDPVEHIVRIAKPSRNAKEARQPASIRAKAVPPSSRPKKVRKKI